MVAEGMGGEEVNELISVLLSKPSALDNQINHCGGFGAVWPAK